MDERIQANLGCELRPSHGREAIVLYIFLSLANILVLINVANYTDDTEALLDWWTKGPKDGGVYMAGPLIAQEMICIYTMIDLIRNKIHMMNVFVASSTKTCRRLAEKFGIKSEYERKELIQYLSYHLNLTSNKVENGLCEALRWKYGANNRAFYDTIGRNIYSVESGSLRSFRVDGTEEQLPDTWWNFGVDDAGDYLCNGGVQWWRRGWRERHEGELLGNLVLSRNR